MTQNSNPPSIDDLLKASEWEVRLAEARAKREQVLAAKANPKPATIVPEQPEVFLYRNPPAQSAPKRHGNRALALAVVSGLAIGAAVAGIAVWVLQTGPGVSNSGSEPDADMPAQESGVALPETGGDVTRQASLDPLSVARSQARSV